MLTLRYLNDLLPQLVPLRDVVTDPEVQIFLQKRQIPARVYSELFYLPNLKSWAITQLNAGRMLRLNMASPELLNPSCMPWTRYYPCHSLDPRLYLGPGYEWLSGGFLLTLCRDKSGSVCYIMARALDMRASLNNRYVLICGPEGKRRNSLRAANLEQLSSVEKIYLVEGALDRFYLPNCAALCGHENLWDSLEEIAQTGIENNKVCVILDNETHLRYLLRIRRMLLASGYSVMFWPKSCASKDINELAMSGMSDNEIKVFVDRHSVEKSDSWHYLSRDTWYWLSDLMWPPRQRFLHWLKRIKFYSSHPLEIVAKVRRHLETCF